MRPQDTLFLYFRILSRICTLADIRIWSIKRHNKQNLHLNKAHRKSWCTRVIKVLWERVFHCLNLHQEMLEIFSGVNKIPWSTCLWMMPSSPTQRDLSSLVINTPKAWVCKNQTSNTCQKSHVKDHFYFLTSTFNTSEPCIEILSDQTVWQFEKLEHLPIHHLGRWQ